MSVSFPYRKFKNVQFEIIQNKDKDVFCRNVETALNEGWELHGKTIIENGVFYQAVMHRNYEIMEPKPVVEKHYRDQLF